MSSFWDWSISFSATYQSTTFKAIVKIANMNESVNESKCLGVRGRAGASAAERFSYGANMGASTRSGAVLTRCMVSFSQYRPWNIFYSSISVAFPDPASLLRSNFQIQLYGFGMVWYFHRMFEKRQESRLYIFVIIRSTWRESGCRVQQILTPVNL